MVEPVAVLSVGMFPPTLELLWAEVMGEWWADHWWGTELHSMAPGWGAGCPPHCAAPVSSISPHHNPGVPQGSSMNCTAHGGKLRQRDKASQPCLCWEMLMRKGQEASPSASYHTVPAWDRNERLLVHCWLPWMCRKPKSQTTRITQRTTIQETSWFVLLWSKSPGFNPQSPLCYNCHPALLHTSQISAVPTWGWHEPLAKAFD